MTVHTPPRRRAVLLAGTAVVAAAFAAPALAASPSVVVTGTGTVTMTQPTINNFGAVSLTGTSASTTSGVGTFTVTDTTVPSQGWHVSVSATLFCTGGSLGTTSSCPTNTSGLPAGSLAESAPASATGGTGTTPTLTAAAALDGSTGVKLVSAPSSTSGNWTVGVSTMTLTVPAGQTPGTYTSGVTYTVTQGP